MSASSTNQEEKKLDENEAFERFSLRRYRIASFADELYKLKSELTTVPQTLAQENTQKAWIKSKLYPLHGRLGYFVEEFLKPRF